jgi:hypothetical protein
LSELGVYGRIILKRLLEGIGWGGVDWTYLVQKRDKWWVLREHGNEPSGSIKCGDFL